jgi:uncharacterized membrane protein YhhN
MPQAPIPRPLRLGFLIAALVLAANLAAALLIDFGVGDGVGASGEDVLDLLRRALMWAMMPPIAVALIWIGALRHPVGRWHVAALLLCWLGDGLGSVTEETLVLLGLFMAGKLSYIASLWPTRRRSLAWSWGALGYGAVGLISGAIIASSAGSLAVPVLVFALVVAAMAAFAAIDTIGLLGGLLFMVSVLILGLGLYVIEIPDALRAFVVLVPYVGGQALLALSLQQRLGLGAATGAVRLG